MAAKKKTTATTTKLAPQALATRQFEERFGRKPTVREASTLKKGAKLSIEDVKLAGCLINYPQH